MRRELGPKTIELINVLEDLAHLLDQDGEAHWRKWILAARFRILSSDYSGVEQVLKAYGGMGSFSDFVLGQSTENGAFCWKPNYRELNERLNKLRSDAWQLADWIKRHHETADA